MILTIDVGNSSVYSIVYNRQEEIVLENRFDTLKECDQAYYLKHFKGIKEQSSDIKQVVLSCVVPKINDCLVEVLNKVFEQEVLEVSVKNSSLDIHLDNPQEIGDDFIASALGAMIQYELPVIIIDMGTASKISVVDYPNLFLGGIIQPGLNQMREILHQNISHLPKIELVQPKKLIGTNTLECIQSGIVSGSLLGLIGMAKQMESDLNKPFKIVLTGGYGNLYQETYGIEFNPYLINQGLLALARKGLRDDQ